MAKNIIRTTKKVAKTASRLLRKSNSKKIKRVAASALSNRRKKTK